jgi:hypothetical protein
MTLMNEDFLKGLIAGIMISAALYIIFEADKQPPDCEINETHAEQLDEMNIGNWRMLKQEYRYLDFDCQQKVRNFAFSLPPDCSRRILNICSGAPNV